MTVSADLRSAEARVEARSTVLKKELGLKDIVPAQLLIVLGPFGVGTAAKVGPSHLVFWLCALLLFYLPFTATVIYLNRLMPLEGGLYQWAKFGFNEFVGFLAAWNCWLFGILYISSAGLSIATAISYSTGPGGAWIAGSPWVIAAASCVSVGALVIVAIRGLGVAKWVHDAGSAVQLLAFATLLALPLMNVAQGTLADYPALQFALPPPSLLNLTIFAKMAVFALGGFEYVVILAGECRQPGRTINQSVVIAAPLIAAVYIFGTHSILAFVGPDQVDLINPLAQAFSLGFRPFGIVAAVVPMIILAMLGRDLAQFSYAFTGNTRLPMVAGWDRLLPAWFTRLHARHKTPVNSILFAGALMLGFGLAGLIGVGAQVAYQLLLSATGIFVATTNLVMFAIPLFGLRQHGLRPPLWLRLAAASGCLMVLLFIALSIVPIIEVKSPLAYAVKISLVVVIANTMGTSIFLMARRKRGAIRR